MEHGPCQAGSTDTCDSLVLHPTHVCAQLDAALDCEQGGRPHGAYPCKA